MSVGLAYMGHEIQLTMDSRALYDRYAMYRGIEERREFAKRCTHPELAFASGAYYVICRHCNVRWVAMKWDGDEPESCVDTSRGSSVRPENDDGRRVWIEAVP